MMDSKPRDFGYIYHKDRFPLQLKGDMKRKSRPQSSNSDPRFTPETIFGRNEVEKMKLTNRIIQNYQDLKSVVPADISDRKEKQSIKTYQKEKYLQVSGAAYLMYKSSGNPQHAERRHLKEQPASGNVKQETKLPQKRHFNKTYFESGDENIVQVPRRHTEALDKKLRYDLCSKIDMKENAMSSTVKMNPRSMFREGASLGFEHDKQTKISSAKYQQVAGTRHSDGRPSVKNYRNEWSRSSFVLG